MKTTHINLDTIMWISVYYGKPVQAIVCAKDFYLVVEYLDPLRSDLFVEAEYVNFFNDPITTPKYYYQLISLTDNYDLHTTDVEELRVFLCHEEAIKHALDLNDAELEGVDYRILIEVL